MKPFESYGGADRDRTDDILLAKQALSQLSYSPTSFSITEEWNMVGLGRLELPTSPLSGVRSSQLSYRPGIAEQLCAGWRAYSVARPIPKNGTRTLELSRRFSRTQLNVLSSYAGYDHRC
jgi:hypothetical protein